MTNELKKTFSYRITQATASELVVILYDMAIQYLDDASSSEELVDYQKNLHLASRVIDQLLLGLDMSFEMSVNLYQIYNHIKRTLISSSVEFKKDEISRVKGLLCKLRKSFYEVSKQDTSAPLMKNAESVYAGLTYSKVGASNETSHDPISNRGFMA